MVFSKKEWPAGIQERAHPDNVRQQHHHTTEVVTRYLKQVRNDDIEKHAIIQALNAHGNQDPCPSSDADVKLRILLVDFRPSFKDDQVAIALQRDNTLLVTCKSRPAVDISGRSTAQTSPNNITAPRPDKNGCIHVRVADPIVWLLFYSGLIRMMCLTTNRWPLKILSNRGNMPQASMLATDNLKWRSDWWIKDEDLATVKARRGTFSAGNVAQDQSAIVHQPSGPIAGNQPTFSIFGFSITRRGAKHPRPLGAAKSSQSVDPKQVHSGLMQQPELRANRSSQDLSGYRLAPSASRGSNLTVASAPK